MALSALGVALLWACASDTAPQADESMASVGAESIESADGTGSATDAAEPIVISGSGLGEARIGAPAPSGWNEAAAQISLECKMLSSSDLVDATAMTDGTIVRRVSVSGSSDAVTPEGVGIGDSEVEVRAAYPRVIASEHKFAEAPAKYLRWQDEDENTALRFVLDSAGRVEAIHAGVAPWVDYIEGCA